MKKIIMLSLCALFAFSPHLGASSTDEAIRGVTTFLKEGFNANKLFIFESKLRENEEFKTHFPETYSNLKFVPLEQLLLTGREALTQDFETDLKNLTQKLIKPLKGTKIKLGDRNEANATQIVLSITEPIFREYNLITSGDKLIFKDIIHVTDENKSESKDKDESKDKNESTSNNVTKEPLNKSPNPPDLS